MDFTEGIKTSIGRRGTGGNGVALSASKRQQRHGEKRQGEHPEHWAECLKAGFHVYKIKPESHRAGS
jgi:hypothetical protein